MLDQFEAKQRYNDYLREVKRAQIYQQVRGQRPNRLQGVIGRLGDFLIVTGHQIKGEKRFPTPPPTHLTPRKAR